MAVAFCPVPSATTQSESELEHARMTVSSRMRDDVVPFLRLMSRRALAYARLMPQGSMAEGHP